jgi:hypothetical protein
MRDKREQQPTKATVTTSEDAEVGQPTQQIQLMKASQMRAQATVNQGDSHDQ